VTAASCDFTQTTRGIPESYPLGAVAQVTHTGVPKISEYTSTRTVILKKPVSPTAGVPVARTQFLTPAAKLHELGFNYTYDKSFTDKLKSATVQEIHDHLLAENEYQKKSVRFLENHDEERAITKFGKEKSKAAATIINTVPGMVLINDGQFEGKKIKLPVQLGREPEEPILNGIKEFYQKLFSITSEEIFKKGEWSLISPATSWTGNETYLNMLALHWKLNDEKRLVVINYSTVVSSCKIKLEVKDYPEELELIDLMNDQIYFRFSDEVYYTGLYVELKPYQSHIFSY